MGPMMGSALGLALQDWKLAGESAKSFGRGVAVIFVVATVGAWLSPLREATPEMVARTTPNLIDLMDGVHRSGARAAASLYRQSLCPRRSCERHPSSSHSTQRRFTVDHRQTLRLLSRAEGKIRLPPNRRSDSHPPARIQAPERTDWGDRRVDQLEASGRSLAADRLPKILPLAGDLTVALSPGRSLPGYLSPRRDESGCQGIRGRASRIQRRVDPERLHRSGARAADGSAVTLKYEYEPNSVTLVKFSDGTMGKVACSLECVMPYVFNIQLYGDRGTVRNNQLFSRKLPGQTSWTTIPTVMTATRDERSARRAMGMPAKV